ncbi:response regulator [Desulfoluna sp.]|uniref:response regulator n=1 Tax=Desulfoluna sp. TaxID=2045199 RepID=UPI00262CEB16|nr:response regulator [Desulfoluna sp.]
MKSPEETPERAAKVLIVDDRPENLALAMKLLASEGYTFATAANGEKAIESTRHFQPDLILMDVMMPPGIDGFEACARLKSDPATADIPVVFVTAKNETKAIVKGFQCGGIDYIPKPFRKEEVLSRIRTHIRIRQLIRTQTKLIEELQNALTLVKTLRGLLPICASCKKVRDDGGYWHQIEKYISSHSDLDFTHGICNDCAKRLYPGIDLSNPTDNESEPEQK